MANLSALQASIEALALQVTNTVGVQNSAIQALGSITPIVQAAVDAALAADNAVDDAAASSASQAVAGALAALASNTDLLAEAIAANSTPPVPDPPPEP